MKKISLFLACLSVLILANDQGKESMIQPKFETFTNVKNYKALKKKDEGIHFDQNSMMTNGIYNYVYSPLSKNIRKKQNIFLNGFFEKIERFEPLFFQNGMLEKDSNKRLNKIIKRIKYYVNKEHKDVAVTIIGYTQKIEDKNTKISLESKYTNFFQNRAQRDDADPKEANKKAYNYMEVVYETLLDNNISKKIIYKENRVGKDPLYTEEFSEGRDKNNRVDVALYVKSLSDTDTDKDGVYDLKDYCPDTPMGSSVDQNGCPRLMSLDIKFDFDKAVISDKESLAAIDKLIKFMKKYPAYHAHIIGNTDDIGHEKYNMGLSIRRAEEVVRIMEKAGIEPKRLSYEGKGESEPLVENINPFNRHMNRRIVVELILPVKQNSNSKGFKTKRMGD